MSVEHVRRVLGADVHTDDRGAHYSDKRYLVAPNGWLMAATTEDAAPLPGWHFGVGASWEDAVDAYGEAVLKNGIAPVAAALGRYNFTAHDEHRMYVLLEQVLREAGLTFVREHPLAEVEEHQAEKKSRLDFWFPELRVAMEVKVRGAPHRVLSQIQRYAEHPAVGGLVLATSLAKLAKVPDHLGFKPVRAVRLAGAFG
jgi:hypothetical protein